MMRLRWQALSAAYAHCTFTRGITGVSDRQQLLAALKELQARAPSQSDQIEAQGSPSVQVSLHSEDASPQGHHRPGTRQVLVRAFMQRMTALASECNVTELLQEAKEFRTAHYDWDKAEQVIAAAVAHATRRLLKVSRVAHHQVSSHLNYACMLLCMRSTHDTASGTAASPPAHARSHSHQCQLAPPSKSRWAANPRQQHPVRIKHSNQGHVCIGARAHHQLLTSLLLAPAEQHHPPLPGLRSPAQQRAAAAAQPSAAGIRGAARDAGMCCTGRPHRGPGSRPQLLLPRWRHCSASHADDATKHTSGGSLSIALAAADDDGKQI